MKIDIDLVKENIQERFIEVPQNLNKEELHMWLEGYSYCYESHLDLLEEMKEQYGNQTS